MGKWIGIWYILHLARGQVHILKVLNRGRKNVNHKNVVRIEWYNLKASLMALI